MPSHGATKRTKRSNRPKRHKPSKGKGSKRRGSRKGKGSKGKGSKGKGSKGKGSKSKTAKRGGKRRSQRPWKELDPSKKQRRSMPSHCFLAPRQRKYPICPKGSRKPTLQGVRAALSRASINASKYGGYHIGVKKRAMALYHRMK
jgi:hypothetical protein